jgi:uncharacterized protein
VVWFIFIFLPTMMKLQAERFEGQNAITRHSTEGVVVSQTTFTASVIIPWQGSVQPWDAVDFETLQELHFSQLIALKPEIVIFGSGPHLRFPHPRLYQALLQNRIGFETMDTPAACRTYNVLLQEDRSVVAALLFAIPA